MNLKFSHRFFHHGLSIREKFVKNIHKKKKNFPRWCFFEHFHNLWVVYMRENFSCFSTMSKTLLENSRKILKRMMEDEEIHTWKLLGIVLWFSLEFPLTIFDILENWYELLFPFPLHHLNTDMTHKTLIKLKDIVHQ